MKKMAKSNLKLIYSKRMILTAKIMYNVEKIFTDISGLYRN